MRWLRALLLRFSGLFRKRESDQEIADELASHVQMHIEDNLRRGMNAQEARREALMKLGGVAQTEESYRERRGVPIVETLLCLLYTSPSPRDLSTSRMPSSA